MPKKPIRAIQESLCWQSRLKFSLSSHPTILSFFFSFLFLSSNPNSLKPKWTAWIRWTGTTWYPPDPKKFQVLVGGVREGGRDDVALVKQMKGTWNYGRGKRIEWWWSLSPEFNQWSGNLRKRFQKMRICFNFCVSFSRVFVGRIIHFWRISDTVSNYWYSSFFFFFWKATTVSWILCIVTSLRPKGHQQPVVSLQRWLLPSNLA